MRKKEKGREEKKKGGNRQNSTFFVASSGEGFQEGLGRISNWVGQLLHYIRLHSLHYIILHITNNAMY